MKETMEMFDNVLKILQSDYKYVPLTREHAIQMFIDLRDELEGHFELDDVNIKMDGYSGTSIYVTNGQEEFMMTIRADNKGYFGNVSWDTKKFVELYTEEESS